MNLSTMLSEANALLKHWFTPTYTDRLFVALLLVSYSLWTLDALTTRTAVWQYGTSIELNPQARQIYEELGALHAFPLFMGFITLTHSFAWLFYRWLPLYGWFILTGALTVTTYTNLFNVGLF